MVLLKAELLHMIVHFPPERARFSLSVYIYVFYITLTDIKVKTSKEKDGYMNVTISQFIE